MSGALASPQIPTAAPVKHALKMGARGGLIGALVLGGAPLLYRSMAGALGLPAWDSPIVS